MGSLLPELGNNTVPELGTTTRRALLFRHSRTICPVWNWWLSLLDSDLCPLLRALRFFELATALAPLSKFSLLPFHLLPPKCLFYEATATAPVNIACIK